MNHTLIGLNLRMNAVNWRWKQVEPAGPAEAEHGRVEAGEAAAAEHEGERHARGRFGEGCLEKGAAVPGRRPAGKERRHVR